MSASFTTLSKTPLVSDDDAVLLDLYCRTRDPQAFEAMVQKHIGWIGALARRRVKDRHLAEDVAQAVFIVLARKATTISEDTPLSAWLFRVARYAANDAIKHESRHRNRINNLAIQRVERETSAVPRADAGPDLDDALACLGDIDRQAILLRFYEDLSMAEIGASLGINEVAAKKRVSRALRRLREVMARRGAVVGSLVMLALLLLRGNRADAAAIGSLAKTMARAATGATDASGRSVMVADATLRRLAGAKARLLAALAGSAVVLVFGVSTISPVMGQIIQPIWNAVESVFDFSSTVAPASAVVPDDAPKPKAPVASEPVISRVWVGRTGGVAWPVGPSQAGAWPIQIQSKAADQPVAIVEDARGRLWYRPVSSSSVPTAPPKLADNTDEYADLNPNLFTNDRNLDDMIQQGAAQFRDASASDGGLGGWHPVDQVAPDGGVFLPNIDSGNFLAPDVFAGSSSGSETKLAVPEPTTIATLGLASTLLLRRRRR